MLAEREMMVQPYVASVDGYGERSMVWIDGQVTHAIRKTPRFLADPEQVSSAIPIAPEERALAEQLLALTPEALYGRVDLARDEAGRPMVMELELLEPSLFFLQSASALERFVRAVVARAETGAARWPGGSTPD
jgi:hypothetical protein